MLRLLKNTVFDPIAEDWASDKVLAVLFHRSATVLYLIYFFWGVSAMVGSIPTLVRAQGDFFQMFFSLLVSIVSILAFFGALHFPKNARLEMFCAASLATLVIVYEVFLAIAFVEGGRPGLGPTFILSLSYLVIPITRVVFIYVTLIKQARSKS